MNDAVMVRRKELMEACTQLLKRNSYENKSDFDTLVNITNLNPPVSKSENVSMIDKFSILRTITRSLKKGYTDFEKGNIMSLKYLTANQICFVIHMFMGYKAEEYLTVDKDATYENIDKYLERHGESEVEYQTLSDILKLNYTYRVYTPEGTLTFDWCDIYSYVEKAIVEGACYDINDGQTIKLKYDFGLKPIEGNLLYTKCIIVYNGLEKPKCFIKDENSNLVYHIDVSDSILYGISQLNVIDCITYPKFKDIYGDHPNDKCLYQWYLHSVLKDI